MTRKIAKIAVLVILLATVVARNGNGNESSYVILAESYVVAMQTTF